MTKATLNFRVVRASNLGVVANASAAEAQGGVLSLRGGFEMSAAKPKKPFSQDKFLVRFSLNRKKPFAGARRRFAARKTEAASVAAADSPPAIDKAPADKAPAETKSGAKPLNDTVAGALARAASQSTIHPLDTVKVQMQAGTFGKALGSGGVSKFGSLVPPSGAAKIIPGIASLYRGVFGAASGAGIAIGAYFAIYSTTTRLLDLHVKPRLGEGVPPGAIAFTAGAIAAAGGSFVKVPLAVCIRSVQAGVYPNFVNASKSIVKAAGARGLFTGFLPTFLEDVPDMAVKFACYETLRSLHRKMNKGKPSTAQEDLVMGGFSGSVAAAATTPLDVIKTTMMCSAATRPSVVGACKSIWAQGLGPKAFFTGVGARSLSNGVNTAVFFAFFEAIKGCMDKREATKEAGRRKTEIDQLVQAEEAFAQGSSQMVPCMGASMSQTAVNQHLKK